MASGGQAAMHVSVWTPRALRSGDRRPFMVTGGFTDKAENASSAPNFGPSGLAKPATTLSRRGVFQMRAELIALAAAVIILVVASEKLLAARAVLVGG